MVHLSLGYVLDIVYIYMISFLRVFPNRYSMNITFQILSEFSLFERLSSHGWMWLSRGLKKWRLVNFQAERVRSRWGSWALKVGSGFFYTPED